MIHVSLNLYGAFRQLGVGQIALQVPEAGTVLNLREALAEYLRQRSLQDMLTELTIPTQLIQASVFASDKAILKDEDVVESGCTLSLFPPVCGG